VARLGLLPDRPCRRRHSPDVGYIFGGDMSDDEKDDLAYGLLCFLYVYALGGFLLILMRHV
jgi:hypothetical protein